LFLSDNFFPKIPNLRLEIRYFGLLGGNLGQKVNIRALVISSVRNLQLSVGKLQLFPHFNFLSHDAIVWTKNEQNREIQHFVFLDEIWMKIRNLGRILDSW